jgi:hypothetical protein
VFLIIFKLFIIIKQRAGSQELRRCLLSTYIFGPEGGDKKFLRNVDEFLLQSTASHHMTVCLLYTVAAVSTSTPTHLGNVDTG